MIVDTEGEVMVSGRITIMEKNGLHMRPAKVLCQVAAEYKCKVSLLTGNTAANAKSLLNVLGAGIKQGMNIEVVCEGEDEEQALERIMNVLSDIKEN